MRYLVMPAMAVLLPVLIIWSMTTPTEKMSIEWQLAVVNAENRIDLQFNPRDGDICRL